MLTALAAVASIAKVVVMIHGAGGGGWEYRYWRPIFERQGYRVITPDMVPAAGGLAATTFEDYVNQVVKAAGDRPDVMIGASMGGLLVLKAAERAHPRALILVGSALPLADGIPRRIRPSAPAIVKWAGGPLADTIASMPDSDSATQHYAWPRWRDESGAVVNTLAAGVSVARPAIPTLVIIGEADDTVPPDSQQALARWAGADTHRYRGMSHVGPLFSRRREEVATAAVAWLKTRFR